MTDSPSADGTLVGRFVSLKRQLIDQCNGDLSAVGRVAKADKEFRRLCCDLQEIAMKLRLAENEAADGVIQHVNSVFIGEWRDFDEHLSVQVSHIFFCDMFGLEPNENISTTQDKRERQADISDLAEFGAQSIEAIFQHMTFLLDDFDEEFALIVEEGIKSWDEIKQGAGLDVEGALRRAKLVPRLLMPLHVSSAFGLSDRLSLLEKWKDARRAFIFGAILAAIAMTRSILETCLKRVYKVDGYRLSEMLKSFEEMRKNKRVSINRRRLDEIKFVANAVLHVERHQQKITNVDAAHIDKAIDSLETWTAEALRVLRSLIEEAPTSIDPASMGAHKNSPHNMSRDD